ncbi:MFS transporter [Crassaminicella profunda]|uniref:MFS transporter n=1 Tax=Crassaminicella profunda TaxID=1286698 RepID=UPI001CA76AFA|nr:MFS transporter [Crassaminicella profunda]QZY54466.1 MFS transporter [Crassaminicella profunda]
MRKNKNLFVILMILLLIISIFYNKQRYFENIWSGENKLENVFTAIKDVKDNYYIVTSSRSKIIKTAYDGTVLKEFYRSNDYDKNFYYVNDIDVDEDGYFYVLSTYFDELGSFIERESILKYSPDGEFEKKLYTKEYKEEDNVPLNGKIKNIKINDERIDFSFCKGNEIKLYGLNKETGVIIKEKKHIFFEADSYIYDIDIYPDFSKFIFTTKDGKVYMGDLEKQIHSTMYKEGEKLVIPCEVQISSKGKVYISDIGQGRIFCIDKKSVKDILNKEICEKKAYVDDFYEFKKFKINKEDHIIVCNNDKVIDFTLGKGLKIIDKWKISLGRSVFNIILWLQLIVLIYFMFIFIRKLYDKISMGNRKLVKQSVLIIIMLISTSSIVTNIVYENMASRYEENQYENLLTKLEIAKKSIHGNELEKLQSLNQYRSKDFIDLVNGLNKCITVNDDLDYSMYAGLYKVINQKVHIVTYNDADTDMFHPYNYDFKNSPFYEVYHKGEVYKAKEKDNDGEWMYVLGPVYNTKNEIVGIIEVGKDLLAYKEANKNMFKALFMKLLVIITILLFIFMEMIIFDHKVLDKKNQINISGREKNEVDVGVIRFVCFIMYMGIFMSSTFLVIYAKKLYEPLWGLPENIVIALPMVIETTLLAITSIVYGHIKHAYSMKMDMLFGCVVMIIGSIFTANISSSIGLIFSRGLFGIGFGLFLIAMRTYMLSTKDEEKKEAGIVAFSAGALAGINAGSVIGSMIVGKIGYAKVFYVISVVIVVGGGFIFKFIKNKFKYQQENEKKDISLLNFVMNKDVLTFFILEFLPSAICGMFLYFFFPIFIDEKGLTPEIVGRAFLLYGVCTIYLGPSLTKITSKYLGARKSIIVAALMLAGTMFIFAWNHSIWIAFMVVIMLGITDSFGLNHEMDYFSQLDPVQRLGESKSMGVYSLYESLGEALGPLVYGMIMTFSMQKGISILAIMLVVAILLFMMGSKNAVKTKEKIEG